MSKALKEMKLRLTFGDGSRFILGSIIVLAFTSGSGNGCAESADMMRDIEWFRVWSFDKQLSFCS